MNLSGIIAISGRAGLYKVIAQGKNNLIVESLDDRKRFPAYASDRISALEDISIYTNDEDVALKVIMDSIYKKENAGEAISHKADQKSLESYLLEILPNYDQERVYISDIKKIFQWYNLLHKAGELKMEEEVAEVVAESTDDAAVTDGDAKKETAKKPAVKKAPAKKITDKQTTTKVTAKSTGTKKVATPKSGTSRGK
jgi:topoisomerase IA-like protein